MDVSEKESVSKSNALKNTTDSHEGRQNAYIIYEHYRATGAFEAVQGLSDLFDIRS